MRRRKHTFRSDLCRFLLVVAFISSVLQLLYFFFQHRHSHVSDDRDISLLSTTHLLAIPFAWNRLHFSSDPPPESLNIALFLGGDSPSITHRALTLHIALARRGHTVHVFSVYQLNSLFLELHHNVHFHLSKPSPFGTMNHVLARKQFSEQNATTPFDVVHTQGTALPHFQANGLPNAVISWDGIPFRSLAVNSTLGCLAEHPWHRWWIQTTEEHRFFDSYAHHVATDEIDAEVLKKEHKIPQSRVHVIFDGVDEEKFTTNLDRGMDFRRWHGVPDSAALVLGITKGSVGDNLHHVLTEAMRRMIKEDTTTTDSVFFLVAGDGPWVDWYREIGPNVLIVGPLSHNLLPDFYNALDILVYPAFGVKTLDQTAKEAMLSAKHVMIIAFDSETELRNETLSSDKDSVLSDKLLRVKANLLGAIRDGREVLWEKGKERRHSAMHLFTRTKMVAAYERLFLCISRSTENGKEYCRYPLLSD